MSFPWAKRYEPKHPAMRWLDDKLPIPRFVFSVTGVGYPVPRNLNYFWNFGVLNGAAVLIQIVTGIVLAMHYSANGDIAFERVVYIMRDVNSGWFIRYAHMNGASLFFISVYIHMFRGLYFGSYKAPREMAWLLGLVILLLLMATAFMGYVLPWGQMSFWGARVITGLFSAIPLIGEPIQTWLLGGYSPDNPTLNRFFALHYLLPFVIAAVAVLHVWAIHIPGSNNPTGVDVQGPQDTVPFHPYYTAKDGFSLAVAMTLFTTVVFFFPDAFGHPDNYIPANPLRPRHTSCPNGISGRSTRSCAHSPSTSSCPPNCGACWRCSGRSSCCSSCPGSTLPRCGRDITARCSANSSGSGWCPACWCWAIAAGRLPSRSISPSLRSPQSIISRTS